MLNDFYRKNFRNANVLLENKVIGAFVGGAVASFTQTEGGLGDRVVAAIGAGLAAGIVAWATPNSAITVKN